MSICVYPWINNFFKIWNFIILTKRNGGSKKRIKSEDKTNFNKYLFYGLSGLTLLIVGLIASFSLQHGFSGDQTLFYLFSKAIDNGAVLYRDVWDIKQPAIFVFYLTGGKLFGFTEVGIHLFEMIYWLIFSLIMIFVLKGYFNNPFFAILTPLFSVGIFYSVSGGLHLTQAEALVCFPLFASLFFCQKFLENPDRKSLLFLSGLFGGIVLTFKLLFIVILLFFWLYLFLFFKKDLRKIIYSTELILFGLLIPIIAVIVYFIWQGAFGDLFYATFVYPSNAVIEITKMEDRTGYLINGLVWFFKSYFPTIFLTGILFLLSIKSALSARRKKERFFLNNENYLFNGLFLWVFSGLAVILIQRLSWWEYHYSLLMIPLGILAARGVEKVFEEIKNSGSLKWKKPLYLVLSAVIMLAFIPTARRLVHKIRLANEVVTIKIKDREFDISGDSVGDYRSISADTAFLREEIPAPSMFIVSNPLYYYLSGSTPVFASNGAMSDMFTAHEWNRLNREMSENLPKYIFIETRFLKPIAIENPEFLNTVKSKYTLHTTGERGSFYKLKQ